MPVTGTTAHGLTSGNQTSLTFSKTSTTDPLYVLLSWFVSLGAVDSVDRVTGVTFDGVALTKGGSAALRGQTMQWWRLATPAAVTGNVVITLSSGRRVTAAAVNLSGWPSAIGDHVFAAVAGYLASGQPSLAITSDPAAEVIDWLGWNDPLNVSTPGGGQTELWSQDGMGGGSGSGGDQKSAGSLKTGASPTATTSWTLAGTTAEYWGLASLSFVPDPAPTPFEDGEPGTIPIIELTDRSDTVRPMSNIDGLNDLNDYYGGYKAPKVQSFKPIRRGLSDSSGQLTHPSFGAIVSDKDRALRALLGDDTNQFLANCPLVARTVSDVDRRARRPMHYEMAGFVGPHDAAEGFLFELDGQSWLQQRLSRRNKAPEFWQPLLTRPDFQLLPDALVNKGAPFYYGKVSDEASGATLYPRGTFDPGWLALDYALVALAGPAAGDYCVYVTAIRDGVESTVMRTGLGFDLNGSQQVDVSFRTSTTPTIYRVYFSDGRADFHPFTNPTGGSFARYRDYLASDIPETGGKTFAEVYDELGDSAASSSLVADYGSIIGADDAQKLQDYWDTHGNIPNTKTGLANIIGSSDINLLMSGTRTVRIDSVTWGSDYVAVAGSIIGRGAAPTLYVGEETFGGITRSAFLVCRGAIKSIVGAYVGGERRSSTGSGTELEVPFLDDYATTFGANYRTINGTRYTIVYATGATAANAINGSKPITVNLWGIESTGDTTGTLLTSPVRQRQHFVRNFLASDAIPTGDWLTVAPDFPGVTGLSLQNDASYDEAEAALQARIPGGYETAGGIGVNGEFESALDVLAGFHVSGDFDGGTNRLGQDYVSVEPSEAPADEDVLTLDDVLTINEGSFSVKTELTRDFWNVIPFVHTKDYTGVTQSGWFLSGESRDAASITNYGQERVADQQQFRFLRSTTTQGAATVVDVVKRKRLRWRHPLRIVTLTVPYLEGASSELGKVLRVTHAEGLSSTGWSGRDIRAREIGTDLDAMSREFECYDLGQIYAGLDDAVDPTQNTEALRDQSSIVQLQENVTNLQVDVSTVQAEIVGLDADITTLQANLPRRGRVRVATTANITIATALNNGDTLDGVTLATGDLVLVKDQTAPEENGVYVVGATPARFAEFDAYDEHPGTLFTVQEGTANADTLWLCTSNVGGTLNTTAIAFTQLTGGSGAPTNAQYVTLATNGTLSDERVLTAGAGITITDAGAGSTVTIKNTATRVFGIGVNGGGAVLTTGVKGEWTAPVAGTITKIRILLDQSGSIVYDVWKDTYANYPPTVADTIFSGSKPTISGAAKYEDTTLTGVTTAFAAGDTFIFNIDSISTATRATIFIEYTPS